MHIGDNTVESNTVEGANPRYSFGSGAHQISKDPHNESKNKALLRAKLNWNDRKDNAPNIDAQNYEVSIVISLYCSYVFDLVSIILL